jgi:hypothetical protein
MAGTLQSDHSKRCGFRNSLPGHLEVSVLSESALKCLMSLVLTNVSSQRTPWNVR